MKRRYRSGKEATRVRTEACRMAADIVAGEGAWTGDESTDRLWSLCVFFESYIANGPKATRRDMAIDSKRKPDGPKAAVVQLIRRDD